MYLFIISYLSRSSVGFSHIADCESSCMLLTSYYIWTKSVCTGSTISNLQIANWPYSCLFSGSLSHFAFCYYFLQSLSCLCHHVLLCAISVIVNTWRSVLKWHAVFARDYRENYILLVAAPFETGHYCCIRAFGRFKNFQSKKRKKNIAELPLIWKLVI